MNIRNLKLAFFAAIMLLLLGGCGGSSTAASGTTTSGGGTTTSPGHPYFKLKQGDTWTYNRTYVYNPGTINAITSSSTVVNSVSTTTSGNTAGTSVSTSNGYSTTATLTFSFDAASNLLMTDTQSQNTLFISGAVNNVKYLPATPAVNNTWTVLGMTFTVTSTSGSITTAAGAFTNCLVVTASGTDNFSGSTINTTNYFSATAGNLVYITGTGVSSGGTPFNITVDMTNYTLY